MQIVGINQPSWALRRISWIQQVRAPLPMIPNRLSLVYAWVGIGGLYFYTVPNKVDNFLIFLFVFMPSIAAIWFIWFAYAVHQIEQKKLVSEQKYFFIGRNNGNMYFAEADGDQNNSKIYWNVPINDVNAFIVSTEDELSATAVAASDRKTKSHINHNIIMLQLNDGQVFRIARDAGSKAETINLHAQLTRIFITERPRKIEVANSTTANGNPIQSPDYDPV